MTQARFPQWIAKCDWDANGNFTGTYDDISTRLLATPGVDVQLGRDSARPLGQPVVPSGGYTAYNDDKVLSAEYPASPLYNLLTAGRPALLQARYGTDISLDDADMLVDAYDVAVDGTTDLGVLRGIIDEPEQHPEIGNRTVAFRLLGSLLKLRGIQVTTPLRQTYRTDQAITEILDAAGWPADRRAISQGDTTMAWWWLNQTDAYQALVDLFYTEGAGAALYEDGDGTLHFENRNYRAVASRSTTVQSTWSDFDGADIGVDDSGADMDAYSAFVDGGVGSFWFTAMQYRPEQKSIINDVTGEAKIRTAQTVQKVWEYGSTLTVTAGTAQTVYATGTDPWTGVVTPALTTDYTLTGTASISVATVVSAQRVAITFTATGSGSATIAGPSGAATGPQLRAQPVTVTSTVQVVNAVTTEVSTSRTRHGNRSPDGMNWSPRTELTPASLQAVVDTLVAYHAEPRPVVQITVRNASALYLWQQLTRQVSDRIRIVETQTGVANDFWIEQINHRATQAGLETTFVCEKVRENYVALWDSNVWDGGDGKMWGL